MKQIKHFKKITNQIGFSQYLKSDGLALYEWTFCKLKNKTSKTS